jgi:hypothetical protein
MSAVDGGTVNLAGDAVLVAGCRVKRPGASNMTGESNVGASLTAIRLAQAALVGDGDLLAELILFLVRANLSGQASLVAACKSLLAGASALQGNAEVLSEARSLYAGAASVVGGATLTSAAQVHAKVTATLSGDAATSAAALGDLEGAADLVGGSAIAAASKVQSAGASAISGASSITAVGLRRRPMVPRPPADLKLPPPPFEATLQEHLVVDTNPPRTRRGDETAMVRGVPQRK